jgi:hypothetical protein
MATVTPGVVYPVNAPYNTTTAYSGTFIPTLWSKKLLVKFYEQTMLSEITNTDYEGELKNMGDTVRIRTTSSMNIRDYEVGMNLQYEVPEPIYQDMQINKGKYYGVKVADLLQKQADLDLMNMFTEEAAKQLKIAIEEEVFFNSFVTEGPDSNNMGATAGELSASYNLGTDAAPISSSDPENVLNAILRMASVLDEQNVPSDGRWLIMSPYDRHILMQSDIAASFFSGDSSSIVRTGKIGVIDRFTTYVSNLLPRGTTSKALVPGRTDVSTGASSGGALPRRVMVAGTKHAISFAATMNKTEPMRDPTDFGDIMRGLSIYGRKVIKPEALAVALIGA